MLVRAGPGSVKVKILFESEIGMSRSTEEMRLKRARWEAILTQSPKAKRFVAASKPVHGEVKLQTKGENWTYHC